jgi:hypothetical protein
MKDESSYGLLIPRWLILTLRSRLPRLPGVASLSGPAWPSLISLVALVALISLCSGLSLIARESGSPSITPITLLSGSTCIASLPGQPRWAGRSRWAWLCRWGRIATADEKQRCDCYES